MGLFGPSKVERYIQLAREEADRTGNAIEVLRNGRVVYTAEPVEKEREYVAPRRLTAEEQAAESARSNKVLMQCMKSWRDKETRDQAARGLVRCSSCNPCPECHGKKWVPAIDGEAKGDFGNTEFAIWCGSHREEIERGLRLLEDVEYEAGDASRPWLSGIHGHCARLLARLNAKSSE